MHHLDGDGSAPFIPLQPDDEIPAATDSSSSRGVDDVVDPRAVGIILQQAKSGSVPKLNGDGSRGDFRSSFGRHNKASIHSKVGHTMVASLAAIMEAEINPSG
ncbi:hypothetical protein ACLOJK_014897 [Asimina triloba]